MWHDQLAAPVGPGKTVAMSGGFSIQIFLSSDDETDRLGRTMAPCLRPGDSLLLAGPVGAGKSHLSRAIIRARLGRMEDVPSPTFTLVQTYEDAAGDLWHADLYRLSGPDDLVELGLEDAFPSAICLVEWPERLGPATPEDPIQITLSSAGEGRSAMIAFRNRADLQAALMGFAHE